MTSSGVENFFSDFSSPLVRSRVEVALFSHLSVYMVTMMRMVKIRNADLGPML